MLLGTGRRECRGSQRTPSLTLQQSAPAAKPYTDRIQAERWHWTYPNNDSPALTEQNGVHEAFMTIIFLGYLSIRVVWI